MRVLLLSDISSEHTEKWAVGFASEGIEVFIFSLHQPFYNWVDKYENITYLNPGKTASVGKRRFSKLVYLKVIPQLKKIIKKIKPDIVHAHYATSYGLLANLSGFRPYVISAWGTDVMKFPEQNKINFFILKNNLNKAALVCATSNTIKEYIHKVVQCRVEVVPFGVDFKKFHPGNSIAAKQKNKLIISCIKSLEKIYCIDVLIKAFALVKEKNKSVPLHLLIVGPGSERKNLELLVQELNLQNDVEFTGRIDYANVQDYFRLTDIFVNISEYESFGVSVIEAMACEKPVVVTDVGGLSEIVDEGITGYKVPVKDVEATAGAIEKLIVSEALRKEMGVKAKLKVEQHYKWENNLKQMIDLYKTITRAN